MRSGGDRGSGTVWMVALMGLVWFVAVVAVTVGGARAVRHRAYAAADMAALAAAAHRSDGVEHACRLAARVARTSGGRLRRCAFHGPVVDVLVTSVSAVRSPFGPLRATARSRAGPVTSPGPMVASHGQK